MAGSDTLVILINSLLAECAFCSPVNVTWILFGGNVYHRVNWMVLLFNPMRYTHMYVCMYVCTYIHTCVCTYVTCMRCTWLPLPARKSRLRAEQTEWACWSTYRRCHRTIRTYKARNFFNLLLLVVWLCECWHWCFAWDRVTELPRNETAWVERIFPPLHLLQIACDWRTSDIDGWPLTAMVSHFHYIIRSPISLKFPNGRKANFIRVRQPILFNRATHVKVYVGCK